MARCGFLLLVSLLLILSAAQAKSLMEPEFGPLDSQWHRTWQLQLDPPIMTEFGLGANGPVTGPATYHFTLWKFGDHLYGCGAYTYSDTNSIVGGSVEGRLSGKNIELALRGKPGLQLTGSLMPAGKGYAGSAILKDVVPGSPIHQSSNARFTLLAEPGNPYNVTSQDDEATFGQVMQVPANVEWWTPLAVLPQFGLYYGERKMLMEAVLSALKHPMDAHICNRLSEHLYGSYCRSKEFRGAQREVTRAIWQSANAARERVKRLDPSQYKPLPAM